MLSMRFQVISIVFTHLLDAYLLFDFPGQVELFTANDNIRKIIQEMDKRGIRVCSSRSHDE